MAEVHDAAARFRRALLERDDEALARIADTYARVDRRAEGLIARLVEQIAERERTGGRVPVSWLYERRRLEVLRDGIAREVARVVPDVDGTVREHAAAAATAGADDALDLVRTAAGRRGPTLRLRPLRLDVVEQLVGTLADGSPLRDLLDDLPGDAGDRVARAVVEGVTLGRNPTVIAREARAALGGNRARAQTIARTEALRAYREASRESWRQQPRIVRGWQWFSTLDRTACPSCVAMHGTIHPVDEPMGTHPSCRCTQVPVLQPGLGEQPSLEPGPDQFAEWDDERQLATLGPSKLAAYRAGEIELPDLVRVRRDPRWGVTRSEASLAEARASARERSRA
jgi:SPP1 gp7 family putative phage head morphogenesis protein